MSSEAIVTKPSSPSYAAWARTLMNVVTIIGAIVLVIGMMLIIIQNFSPITSAIIINGAGFAILGVMFRNLKKNEQEYIRMRLVQQRAEAKSASHEAPHAIPAGYTPPAGWKPGDGCPAMLPDHWFTSQPDDEVAPADPIPEASLSSGALRSRSPIHASTAAV